MKNNYKIVLTGGHAATTAASVVEEIRSQKLDWEIYFIGAKWAIEGKNVETLESKILKDQGVKFLPLVSGRIQRKFTFWTLPSIFKIPLSFIHAFSYLVKIRPNAILSFGGYVSVPVVAIGRALGIPVILHEQTAAIGRANNFASKFANKIALSREESLEYFPKDKYEITGNPVLKEIVAIESKKSPSEHPVVFFTGGSRGAQVINDAVEKSLISLLSKYQIYHQTGELDSRKFEIIRNKLPRIFSSHYHIYSSISPNQMAEIYKKSDVIVGRAGANTVSEIMVIKRPAILVPLPISYLDEQTKNAEYAKKWGIAEIIPQNELTPTNLIGGLEKVFKNYKKIIESVHLKKSPDVDASKKIVNLILEVLK